MSMERMEHRREISKLHKQKLSSTLSPVLNTALKLLKRSMNILGAPWKVNVHDNVGFKKNILKISVLFIPQVSG